MAIKKSKTFRVGAKKLIAVLCTLVFFSACVAVYFVHKHHPLQSVDPRDFDASCYWIKTDKAKKETSCAHLFTGVIPAAFCLIWVKVIIGPLAPDLFISRLAHIFCFYSPRSPPLTLQSI
jgi:hypothetical protein